LGILFITPAILTVNAICRVYSPIGSALAQWQGTRDLRVRFAGKTTRHSSRMTNSLHHLFYVSACIDTLEEGAIQEILDEARAHNAAHSITGVLIYSGSHFAQVLEGSESDLKALLASIRSDVRHQDVRTLLSAPLAVRQFDNWSMGFVCDLSVADLLAELSSASVDAPRASRLIELLFRRAELKLLS
jgi:hypothetical protein